MRVENDSSQANLRHPRWLTYRCFLPDLTGFTRPRRAGPNSQHRIYDVVTNVSGLLKGLSPAEADCRYRTPLTPRLARPPSSIRRALFIFGTYSHPMRRPI